MLGIAEGLSYLTLSLGAVVLTLQVGNPVANLLDQLLMLVLAVDVQHGRLDVKYLGKHLLSGGALELSAYLPPCSLNGSCIPLVCKKHISQKLASMCRSRITATYPQHCQTASAMVTLGPSLLKRSRRRSQKFSAPARRPG